MGFSSNGFFVIIIQLKLFTMATLGTEESVADVESTAVNWGGRDVIWHFGYGYFGSCDEF